MRISAKPSELEIMFKEWLPLRQLDGIPEYHVKYHSDGRGMSDAEFYERIRGGWSLHVASRTVHPPLKRQQSLALFSDAISDKDKSSL